MGEVNFETKNRALFFLLIFTPSMEKKQRAIGVDIGLRYCAIANNEGMYDLNDVDLKVAAYDDIMVHLQTWLNRTRHIWYDSAYAGVEQSDMHILVLRNRGDALRMRYIEGLMVGLLRGDCCIANVHLVSASTYKPFLAIAPAGTRAERKKVAIHWAMNHYFVEPPTEKRIHDIADAAMLAKYLTRLYGL